MKKISRPILHKSRITWVILTVIYASLYIISTKNLLGNTYSNGLVRYDKDFSLMRSMLAILNIFFYSKLLFYKINLSFTNIAIILLFFFSYVPIIANFGILKINYELYIYVNLYWLILLLLKNIKTKQIEGIFKLKIKYLKSILSFLVGIILIYMSFFIRNISFDISLNDVYLVREIYKENASALEVWGKTLFGYFIVPFLIVYYGNIKKFFMVLLFILFELILFSMAKNKIFLLILGISLVIVIAKHIFEQNLVTYCLLGLISGGIFSFVDTWFRNGYAYFYTLVYRRFLFMPAWLNDLYIQFFEHRSKLWWHQDVFFIDKFFVPIYQQSFLQLIAKYFFKGHEFSPNTGLVAEAYMHFGWLGVFLYPILVLLLLAVIEMLVSYYDINIKMIIAFSLSIVMVNDVITSTSFIMVLLLLSCFFILFNIGDRNDKRRIHFTVGKK